MKYVLYILFLYIQQSALQKCSYVLRSSTQFYARYLQKLDNNYEIKGNVTWFSKWYRLQIKIWEMWCAMHSAPFTRLTSNKLKSIAFKRALTSKWTPEWDEGLHIRQTVLWCNCLLLFSYTTNRDFDWILDEVTGFHPFT